MSISGIVEQIMNELTYNRLKTKQKSIGKLFPEFGTRVDAVKANGSIELRDMMPEHWHFSVASGTKEGVSYDVYVQFNDIPEMIKKYAGDKSLLKKDGTPNYMLLAAEILNHVDMKLSCSCPADLYWGGAYIKTQRTSQFGRQEHRPPNIRNPRQYGAYCKHTELVMRLLTGWTSTFASFLKKYWSDEVDEIVELIAQQRAEVGAVAGELGKMAAEPKPARFARGGREVRPPEDEDMGDEGEEPPPDDDEEPPPNVGPQSATRPATTLPAKAEDIGIKRLGIEDEEHPRIKDVKRKGKYTPNESVNEDKGFQDRLGQCYTLSGRFVMDHPEYDLVHGTIKKPGGSDPAIGHAWAEKEVNDGRYQLRMVYDPVLDYEMPWDAYKRFTGAKEIKRYTSDQMVSTIAKEKHWGPWNE